MDQTTVTAVLAIMGGVWLMIYALRVVVDKRRIVKNGNSTRAKVTAIEGKRTIYRFMIGDKSITARSLQRTRYDAKRLNTLEKVFYNPASPNVVVIAHDNSVERSAVLMALVGLLALAGGMITLL